jgi:hypothetical protein
MPGLHATLSASGAKRWMACPPSARLEERLHGIFGDKSSEYAEEGTKAHALSELKLLREKDRLGDSDGINEFNYKARRAALGDIPADMDTFTDYYVNTVMEKYFTARKATKDAKLFVEQRLDFSPWVPHGFGTGDAVILSDELLEVCDLKYGKGVPVSAVENPQARCYGLGAINEFGDLYGFTHVRNTIIQPRLDSVTEETLERVELLDWGVNVLHPAAELAWKGEGEFKPGDHCKFCAARAICAARAAEAMSVFKHGFAAPGVLSDDDIPGILAVLDTAEDWMHDIRDYALSQALRGQQWPGYKLVHGKRAGRRWKNEEEAKEQLVRAGYEPEQYEVTSLKTPTAVEKALGKTAFDAICGKLVSQSDGALTLVPENDKRIEFSSADADFSDMTNNNNTNE